MKPMYIVGLSIFIFGLAFLLRNLGVVYFPGSFWSLFYPLIIVGFGLVIIFVTHEGKKLLNKIKRIISGEEEK